MTAITREYLDELLRDVPRWASFPPETVETLAAALRRVLDLADAYVANPSPAINAFGREMHDTLAGVQTDDGADAPQATERIGAEGTSPAGDAPAPSSPDRIEAVAQALGVIGPAASDRYRMAQAEIAVAALDAYDRGHPTAALRDALAEVAILSGTVTRMGEQAQRLDERHTTCHRERDEARTERDALAAENARLRAQVETLVHGVNHPYGGIDGCARCAPTTTTTED